MLILNAGVPRSGTVLVNAMIRGLLKQAGTGTIQVNPHGRELPVMVAEIKRIGQYHHRPVLVHTHSWDRDTRAMLTGDPHVVALANYRDPRDVCVSLMKLHDLEFDGTMTAVKSYYGAFEAVVRALGAMVIPYELLVTSQRAYCFQIARHLGLWPTFAQVDQVVAETSIDQHRKVMHDVQNGQVPELVERQNRNRVLREDQKTLINDRHIQSGASGRWRSELTDDQQKAATKEFASIIERYGYPA